LDLHDFEEKIVTVTFIVSFSFFMIDCENDVASLPLRQLYRQGLRHEMTTKIWIVNENESYKMNS
jgi:hypothetical protein